YHAVPSGEPPIPPTPHVDGVFHYLHDALGSVIGLVDAAGELVERYTYDPYGKVFIEKWDEDANEGAGDWVASSEPTSGLPHSAVGNPFMWTGQRYDASTATYGFYARSYSPTLGRWLQRDPMEYVDGVNLYEALASSPYVYSDSYGGSIVSYIAKRGAKYGFIRVAREFVKEKIKNKLKRLAEREYGRKLLKEAEDAIDLLDDEWWEIVIELIPVAGDVYGINKCSKRVKQLLNKLDEIEEKTKKYIKNLRQKGVRKAWKREKDLVKRTGRGSHDWTEDQKKELLERGRVSGYEGHHKQTVKDRPDLADDPDNVEILKHEDHMKKHYGD
ncbi:hypothetical protein B7486_53805, partial [cyanobacterium TDX16]